MPFGHMPWRGLAVILDRNGERLIDVGVMGVAEAGLKVKGWFWAVGGLLFCLTGWLGELGMLIIEIDYNDDNDNDREEELMMQS